MREEQQAAKAGGGEFACLQSLGRSSAFFVSLLRFYQIREREREREGKTVRVRDNLKKKNWKFRRGRL